MATGLTHSRSSIAPNQNLAGLRSEGCCEGLLSELWRFDGGERAISSKRGRISLYSPFRYGWSGPRSGQSESPILNQATASSIAPYRHWLGRTLKSSWARTFNWSHGCGRRFGAADRLSGRILSQIARPSRFGREGSTFTIAGLTAWAAIVTHGKTHPGEWVLLQGSRRRFHLCSPAGSADGGPPPS